MATWNTNPRVHKWTKRSYWMVGIVALVWLCLLVTNAFFYEFSIPSECAQYPWRGRWDSEKFGMANGRLHVNLPRELQRGDDLEVKALAYYNIWTMYRIGMPMAFTVHVKMDSDSAGAGLGRQFDSAEDGTLGMVIYMKSGLFEDPRQQVTYSGVYDPSAGTVRGTYRSTLPVDAGTFVLWRD